MSGLIRQYLLDNPHEAVILVTPEPEQDGARRTNSWPTCWRSRRLP